MAIQARGMRITFTDGSTSFIDCRGKFVEQDGGEYTVFSTIPGKPCRSFKAGVGFVKSVEIVN